MPISRCRGSFESSHETGGGALTAGSPAFSTRPAGVGEGRAAAGGAARVLDGLALMAVSVENFGRRASVMARQNFRARACFSLRELYRGETVTVLFQSIDQPGVLSRNEAAPVAHWSGESLGHVVPPLGGKFAPVRFRLKAELRTRRAVTAIA